MSSDTYDVAIVGGGPGGYIAAIRAAQLGLNPVVIEKERVGGVCLNVGCIPTKALLKNAELVLAMRHGEDYGITCDNLKFDMSKAVARSRTAANTLVGGIEYLLKKNKISLIGGHGRLTSASTVEVTSDDGDTQTIEAKSIVISTGSRSKVIPPVPVDGERIITSTEAMLLNEPPESMTIIGGGAIGVEFAYYYAAYGTRVTIIEMLPRLLPVEDAEISAILEKAFGRLEITLKMGARVEKAEAGSSGTTVTVSIDGESETIYSDITLLAIGRDPNTEELGLEEVGVETDRGFVKVDEGYHTSVPGIYAIGDVIGPPLLAHVASAEGINLMERLAGHTPSPIDYDNIPGCTYCQPQVASIGLTEEKAKEEGIAYKVGKFPFAASGKAVAVNHSEGFVKVLVGEKYGEILGAHIIGSDATELIAEYGLGMKLEATVDEIHQTIHAHPTMSEALAEAAAATHGEAIHI